MTTLLDELLDQEFRDKLLIYQTFMNSEGPLLKEEFYGYFDLSTQKLESLHRFLQGVKFFFQLKD